MSLLTTEEIIQHWVGDELYQQNPEAFNEGLQEHAERLMKFLIQQDNDGDLEIPRFLQRKLHKSAYPEIYAAFSLIFKEAHGSLDRTVEEVRGDYFIIPKHWLRYLKGVETALAKLDRANPSPEDRQTQERIQDGDTSDVSEWYNFVSADNDDFKVVVQCRHIDYFVAEALFCDFANEWYTGQHEWKDPTEGYEEFLRRSAK